MSEDHLWDLDERRIVTCEPVISTKRQLGAAHGIGLRSVIQKPDNVEAEQRDREREQ